MALGDKIYENIIQIVGSRDGRTCAFLGEELFAERAHFRVLLSFIKLTTFYSEC